ncbi:UvrD-helicase domain-containing protein [Brevibacillus choshinensis]|uniref:UvrD-helicase domain-containing protein n=1 Tax=Brevibacillus choshinensis TaxID=54911 RepID=UPI002E1E4728|nr:UvrD-helicase domain-containing protein [Brevibacillus choshinensis]MED4785183.1 UvrD-helicase domain-containing protein [Brevibacillus choshinensis]
MLNHAAMEDQAARERILNDLDTTLLVEAGAGSGKTTSLVGRMLNLVKTGRAEMKQIAAITFTNKAASELRGRFRFRLEKEWEKAVDEMERQRLERALQQMNQCMIGTIHSFCGRLLRERPIEAGVDPSFSEMDERTAVEWQNRCWDQYIEMLSETEQYGAMDEWLSLGVTVEDLRVVYLRVSEYEDVTIFTQKVAEPEYDLIRLTVPDMLVAAKKYIPIHAPEKGWDKLQEAIHHASRFLEHTDLVDSRNVLTVAKMFDRSLDVVQNRWTDPAMAKEQRDRFLDWKQTVLQPFLTAWREYLHPQLIQLVLPVIAYSRQKRLEAGMLDFQDLLLRTAELLRRNAEVRAYFARRYTHLLVDEFQDTDPIQAEMMLLLTGAEPDEHDWRHQVPRPGSLFIVGDPKQSIYRFRRADISTYNFVRERVAAHGDVLQLTYNFRSVHAIGDFVNEAFVHRFPPAGEASDHQAQFVKMMTVQENPPEEQHHGVFTITIPKQERDKKEDIVNNDAERIAQYIAWACQGNMLIQEKGRESLTVRHAEPGDFLILLKHRQHIGHYAEKLERYGVPSDTTGSWATYEELKALLTLTTCLNDSSDQISLLAVLRGMFFGVSDEALYHYRMQAGAIRVNSLPSDAFFSEKAMPVYHALLQIQRYREWVSSLPAISAFTRIIDDMGLLPYAATKETGAIRSGTLVKLLEMIHLTPSISASWQELTLFLQRQNDDKAMESCSLFAGSGKAVRIMNVHKAKGLEAPVVFLAGPCGQKEHDATEHVDRGTDPAIGYFTILREKAPFPDELIAQPVGWEEIADKEKVYLLAEEERFLYVATTRARQMLVISQYPSKPTIDPWNMLQDHLQHQPELEVPVRELDMPLQMGEALDNSLHLWDTWRKEASLPTFARSSVTEKAKGIFAGELPRPKEGRGLAFGAVVHRGLEALGNGLALERQDAFIRMVAEEEGLDLKWHEEASKAVKRVINSQLWARSLEARQSFHEFSLFASRENTRLKGVIDFLFEEEDGWVIVDFKNDLYAPEHEQAFIEFYRPQVMTYAEEWERLGYQVKEAGLYFVSQDRYVVTKRA